MLKAACNKGSSGSLWKFVIFTLADTASAIRFLESPALRGFRVSGPGSGHWTTRHRFRKLLNPFRNWGYDNRNGRRRHKASVPGACAGGRMLSARIAVLLNSTLIASVFSENGGSEMYRVFALGCALLCASLANAADDGRCDAVAELAFFIMTARQEGVARDELMEPLTSGEPEAGLARKLLNEAYESAIHSSDEAREKAVAEFQNKAYQQCRKGAQG